VKIVTVTRPRHPLEGSSVRVAGRLRRHGGVELLVVLPDGSKTHVPAGWTDDPAARDSAAAAQAPGTLGSLDDLLASCRLAADLAARAGQASEQAARQSTCQEDNRAACPAQSAPRPDTDATGHRRRTLARRTARGGDGVAGPPDRQGGPAVRGGRRGGR
jgi:hypothetical protein